MFSNFCCGVFCMEKNNLVDKTLDSYCEKAIVPYREENIRKQTLPQG